MTHLIVLDFASLPCNFIHQKVHLVKFVFSKKATKIEKNLHHQFETYYLHNVKSTAKISSIIVALLENMNFIKIISTIERVSLGNW